MTKNDYVDIETARALMKAGFNWPCNAYYTTEDATEGEVWLVTRCNQSRHQGCPSRWTAPTLAQAQKWLRETKSIEVVVEPRYSNNRLIGYDWYVHNDFSGDYTLRAPLPFHTTYESALSAGLYCALVRLL